MNNTMKIDERVYQIIGKTDNPSVVNKTFDLSLISLILLNIASVIISSFRGLSPGMLRFLAVFEIVSVIIFSVEYVLRLWTSRFLYPDARHPALKYAFSAMAIIDLLAIAPFYLPFLISFDLRFVRMLRLFRLLRIFKLNRYNDAIGIIGHVVRREKEKLLTTILFTGIIIIFASSIMYYVENEAQPDKFPNIIASIWWAVATLTTVGYGDVYPITALGKVLSGIIAVLGIGLVALPTGIISSGFVVEMSNKITEEPKESKPKRVCPHCGKEIAEPEDGEVS